MSKIKGIKKILLIITIALIIFPSNICFAEKPLQLYDAGDRVTELQKELIKQGYLLGAADGLYGNQTQAAVAAYQQANGLEATGTADETTLLKLFPEGISVEKRNQTVDVSSETSTLDTMPGYTMLQSFFFSITPDMGQRDVMNLGKQYGLYAYTTSADSERRDYEYTVYVSASKYISHHKYDDSYEFGDADFVSVYYRVKRDEGPVMEVVKYNFGTYVNGTQYSVAYRPQGNLAGSYYSIVHGYVSIDPTATYSSLQDAFDKALALYQ